MKRHARVIPLLGLTDSTARIWLPLAVGLAVGLRATLAITHSFSFPDSPDYVQLAKAILSHETYTAGGNFAARMPGYPVFIALVHAIFGVHEDPNHPEVALLLVQALMGGACVVMVYTLGRRVSHAVGLAAAFLAAVDPLSIGFSAAILSEAPYTFFLLLALCIAARLMEGRPLGRMPEWVSWVMLGAVWGIGVYFRGSALWGIVPVAAWTACVRWQNARAAQAHADSTRASVMPALFALLAIVISLATLVPWQIRNYRLFHSGITRLTTLEGMSLYEAVYPGADGGPKQMTIPVPPEITAMDEAQRSDEWSHRAWKEIESDPLRIAKLAVIKFGRTWSPMFNAQDFNIRPIQVLMALWHIPLFLLALLGIPRVPAAVRILLLVPLVYFTLIHALFLGSVRYRVPLMPVVCLFAAAGLMGLWKWLSSGKRYSTQPV
jgi:hypothetical protein